MTDLPDALRQEALIARKADLPTFGEWAAYVRMLGRLLERAADELERRGVRDMVWPDHRDDGSKS